MSSPQKAPREDAKNDELDRLRYRLRTLNVSTPEELFKELGMIRAEYDAKAAVVEEELALREESLPGLLDRLKQRKAEMRRMKRDVLAQRADYKLHVQKVHEFAAEHCPDVMARLSSINEKMARVDQLKCEERAAELIDNCLLALPLNDAEGVLQTMEAAGRHREEMQLLCPSSAPAYARRLEEVASNVAAWATKRIKQVLESMVWPWSDAQDERAYKAEIGEARLLAAALLVALTMSAADDDVVGSTEAATPVAAAADRLAAAVFDRVATRFRFHFYGARKTADPAHPEWFLSQLILWMRHSLPLYCMVVQPALDREKSAAASAPSAHDSFVRLCCELGREKAAALLDSPEYKQDVTLFSTLIDELIAFEEQRDDWELCPGQFSVLEVLCGEEVRKRWLLVENIACSARVDDILSSETRWNHRFVDSLSDVDPLLVCEAADAFVSLLLCVRARARPLPCPLTRMLFVDLQVVLIDDLRARLVQVANAAASPWQTPFAQIMNAMWYMERSIEEWGEAELVAAVEEEAARADVRGRLGESTRIYKAVWEGMASDVVGSFKQQLRGYAEAYAAHDWRSVSRLRAGDREEISTAFCPLLLRVRTALTQTAEKMCTPAVLIMFRRMLEVVAEVLMKHVITLVHFNCDGAEQMRYDVGVGLVSVVNAVLARTEAATMRVEHEKAMVKVISCLRLLSLTVPNAMLLQEELHAAADDDEAEEKLMAMKMHLVDRELALSLLKRRSDIKLESGGRRPVKIGL